MKITQELYVHENDGQREKLAGSRTLSLPNLRKNFFLSEDAIFRLAVLIQCFSTETITLVKSLPFEDESHRTQVDKVLELLENHFVGEVNEIFESFNFFTRQQRESETNTTFT